MPAGTPLVVHAGNVTVTTPGTVIDRWRITGSLIIKASNVRVTRSLIDGDGTQASVRILDGNSGILIQDTEVRVLHPVNAVDAMSVRGATLNRLNIHGGVDGMKLSSNSVVENSWIHDLRYVASDPAQHGKPSHNDAIQIMGGSNITVKGNYLQATASNNAAIQVTQDSSQVSNLRISGNWADGGGCTFNISSNKAGIGLMSTGAVYVTSNWFGPNRKFAGCGITTDAKVTFVAHGGNVFFDHTAVEFRGAK